MDILVDSAWLKEHLGADDLVVLDATAHLPDAGRDARAEFTAAHIPGARFLDLESFIDEGSPVPKAVPNGEQFAARMRSLGIAPGTRVVLYDDSAVRSAARAWFVFRLYGHQEVAILDGGYAAWRAAGGPCESGAGDEPRPSEYPVPDAQPIVRRKADLLGILGSQAEQVVDARDAARFAGEDGSGSAGHIPGARSVPFGSVLNEDGTYRPAQEIAQVFAQAGVALDRPIVTSCNSGVTAAVLLFALERAGHRGTALYDGSWLEWGSDPATPREQGPART